MGNDEVYQEDVRGIDMYTYPIRSDELYHHGVKGMHWGVRRYQNPDGSLTTSGRKHYGVRGEQKRKLPAGAKVDGYQKRRKLPAGTKIDGPTGHNPVSPNTKSSLSEKQAQYRKQRKVKAALTTAALGAAAVGGTVAAKKSGATDKVDSSVLKQDIKAGKGKSDVSAAEVSARESSKAINEAKNIAKRSADLEREKEAKATEKERKEVISKMSDKELSDAIKRHNLEQQYDRILREDVDNGYDIAAQHLETAASVAQIAVSAVTIAAVLYNLKH